jgi:hypothetical protein
MGAIAHRAYYKIARAFVDDQPSGNFSRDHIRQTPRSTG